MTQEEKDLLLKDLCARLPYGVVCHYQTVVPMAGKVKSYDKLRNISFLMDRPCFQFGSNRDIFDFGNIKPYLFPLSSMTEEQREEISKRYNYHNHYGLCIEITNHSEGYWDDDNSCHLQDYLWLVDFYNKNHIDYRGLIPKGLAIDATGLNIYDN
jgi:hypothetical protein